MKESDLESKCCIYAKAQGWLPLKLTCAVGIPDRVFAHPEHPALFVEFKNPNGKGRLSHVQRVRIASLRISGFTAEVISNYDEFTKLLKGVTNATINDNPESRA